MPSSEILHMSYPKLGMSWCTMVPDVLWDSSLLNLCPKSSLVVAHSDPLLHVFALKRIESSHLPIFPSNSITPRSIGEVPIAPSHVECLELQWIVELRLLRCPASPRSAKARAQRGSKASRIWLQSWKTSQNEKLKENSDFMTPIEDWKVRKVVFLIFSVRPSVRPQLKTQIFHVANLKILNATWCWKKSCMDCELELRHSHLGQSAVQGLRQCPPQHLQDIQDEDSPKKKQNGPRTFFCHRSMISLFYFLSFVKT